MAELRLNICLSDTTHACCRIVSSVRTRTAKQPRTIKEYQWGTSFRQPIYRCHFVILLVMFNGSVKLGLDMCFIYPSLFLSRENEEARRIDDVGYDLPLNNIV